ncbi:type VI secretion system amidase effector protein Tae4 [Serratia sp. UGAL515B_01]|uniref:type VI secretion system amidase effector protein Tae4 n=1 Tax=Serratia sp. UGAL515B_01 TaxID=2986763 RepID=UPI002954D421|nr:type VI secretion system amidase effector protein Tae4 [Serratia sp. UGAL515B_01]WON76236.1 type VI secretion system amidase effector protein Tae4 [Serratia sp. UGAL515B_01]
MASRPSFNSMWSSFSKVNVAVPQVGNIIGGKVKANIDSGIFQNACAIRMSYALNNAGINIPRNESKWKTSSGADNKWYIYRVEDMIKFLNDQFYQADVISKLSVNKSDFSNKKGILAFNVNWSDATGHVTLWNGVLCSDSCYFEKAGGAQLWLLK